MDTQQLNQGLRQAFFKESHRIVFWYDPEHGFTDELGQLHLPGVQVLNMQGLSTFGTKLKLELEDTEGKYLLYFPCAEPDANDDWLLDIKLYSRSFYADKVSLIFNDLGLHQQVLREHLASRERFLSSKARLASLKRLIQPTDTEHELDLAMIAVALACEPKMLIADEPTTALDVTVQMQILRLLRDLRDRLGIAIILITHDLGVVAQTCDRIAVMYGGRLCETGDKRPVLAQAIHPYTRGLIDCQPVSEGGSGRLITLPGQPPVAARFPTGCRFHPRCANATAQCQRMQPAMQTATLTHSHVAACHHPLNGRENESSI